MGLQLGTHASYINVGTFPSLVGSGYLKRCPSLHPPHSSSQKSTCLNFLGHMSVCAKSSHCKKHANNRNSNLSCPTFMITYYGKITPTHVIKTSLVQISRVRSCAFLAGKNGTGQEGATPGSNNSIKN